MYGDYRYPSRYYQFLPGFSTISGLLFALIQKNANFVWGQAQEASFWQLKIHACVFAIPDFGQQFILGIDASGKVLEAILAQEQSDGLLDQLHMPV